MWWLVSEGEVVLPAVTLVASRTGIGCAGAKVERPSPFPSTVFSFVLICRRIGKDHLPSWRS